MSDNIEKAKVVSDFGRGKVYQGVGDKEVESHFTYVKGEGFHLSTYLNDSLMSGKEGNKKIKIDQNNF